MKLVFHSPQHKKNINGIQLMCAARGIDLEFTHDYDRIRRDDYDILVMNERYINPYEIPSRIKIIYGPQHWVFPEGPLVGKRQSELVGRCVYNSLSPWTQAVCESEFSEIILPFGQFPYAVDLDRFKPSSTEKTIDCLVYIKHRSKEIIDAIMKIVQTSGVTYTVIEYGSYDEKDYIDLLGKCKFMIAINAHESQGFAMQEAMAAGVPLLLFGAKSMHDEYAADGTPCYKHLPHKKLLATSAPYWSPDECGILLTELSEFPAALERMRVLWPTFTPRAFIERELSAGVCMDRILRYFSLGEFAGKK